MSAAAVALTGTLAGCSYSQPAKPVEEPVGLPLDAPRVTVLDPGDGEHRVLAFHDIDSEQELTYSVATGFDQQLAKDGSEKSAESAVEAQDLSLIHI